MIPSQFYPTDTTINLTTNNVELTADVIANHAGNLSPYWIGYINSDDIPDFFVPRNLIFFKNQSPLLKIEKYNVDSANFTYVQKSGNETGLDYNYDMATTPLTGTHYYRGINAMSPLNAPVITLSNGFRIEVELKMCYCFEGDSNYKTNNAQIKFTTIKDFLDFMHGETTISATFTMVDSSVSPSVSNNHTITDIRISDIDGTFMYSRKTVGDNAVDYYLSICGFGYNKSTAWHRNDGITVQGNNCYISPAVNVSTDSTNFLFCNYSNDMTVNVAFHNGGIGGSSYITNLSFPNRSAEGYYLNQGNYFLCPFDEENEINFNELKEDPTVFTNIHNGAIIYTNPVQNGRFEMIPCLKAKDILMYFALYPSLSGGNATDIYYPLFSGMMLTGDFFPASELNEKGSDFQKQDDVSKSPYTESDKGVTGQGIDDKEKGTGDFLPSGGLKLIGSGGFVSYYLLQLSDLSNLQNALSVVASSFWEAIGTATDTRTSNLMQYISSLKWYPIDILTGNQGIYADIQTTDINFGFDGNCKLTMTDSFYKLSTSVRVYDLGYVQIPYKIQSSETFLDKDPFTTVQIYLPFCGIYPVKADFVVGKKIDFMYVVDLTTGMCTAIVTNDRQILLNVSGKIGVDYCITGNDIITQSEKLSSSYLNAGTNVISGTVGLAGSAMTGDIMGAITSGVSMVSNIAKASIDIASAKRAVPVAVGSGSGFGSAYGHDIPCVIVNPPAVKIPNDYGHTQGYIYNQSERIGNLSDNSFVICDNPDLSDITADKEELQLLYQILTSGFYI